LRGRHRYDKVEASADWSAGEGVTKLPAPKVLRGGELLRLQTTCLARFLLLVALNLLKSA
jgi:hypothetical protein